MSINFRGLQERLRERLLAHIHAGELTGLQLARAAGFQQAHVSNFLNRKRGLSLEAMDAILQAASISLEELLPATVSDLDRNWNHGSRDNEFVTIPIVDEENCSATQVPKTAYRDSLQVASSVVQHCRPAMHTPRPHWERFIAIRVKAEDAMAMAPRLTQKTVAVVDRHHNSVPENGPDVPDMYLVRTKAGVKIRYVQIAGLFLLTRAHDAAVDCEMMGSRGAPETHAAIIGRLCLLQVQL